MRTAEGNPVPQEVSPFSYFPNITDCELHFLQLNHSIKSFPDHSITLKKNELIFTAALLKVQRTPNFLHIQQCALLFYIPVSMIMIKKYFFLFLTIGWSSNLKSVCFEIAQYELSNGAVVTCTPILEQPSLSSLHWKDAKYQEAPIAKSPGTDTTGAHPDIKHAEQMFSAEAGSCPEGTIPIVQHRGSVTRKLSAATVFRNRYFKSIHSRNTSAGNYSPASDHESELPLVDASKHEYGTAYSGGIDSTFGGAGARFNIWQPYVEDPGEFSLAQFWITAGSYEENNLNTIEVGWQVYENLYGDKIPHIFVYWTTDAYTSTGCYNLLCQGFVQTSSKTLVGGSFTTLSEENGTQYEMKALVYKDSSKVDGDWWLEIDGETVGYWPSSLFTLLNTGAENINWGGEIINDQSKTGRHTKTDMGSGEFAEAGFQKAAYIRHMQSVNLQSTVSDAPLDLNDGPSETDSGCYTALKGTSFTNWGTYIFFGGAGYSDNCLKHT
ncbi:hypothetical protein Mapa_011171 [Marchantia paleacea]|nr:hypothetical protein Mapa_011171 [Marchantia paleacea]